MAYRRLQRRRGVCLAGYRQRNSQRRPGIQNSRLSAPPAAAGTPRTTIQASWPTSTATAWPISSASATTGFTFRSATAEGISERRLDIATYGFWTSAGGWVSRTHYPRRWPTSTATAWPSSASAPTAYTAGGRRADISPRRPGIQQLRRPAARRRLDQREPVSETSGSTSTAITRPTSSASAPMGRRFHWPPAEGHFRSTDRRSPQTSVSSPTVADWLEQETCTHAPSATSNSDTRVADIIGFGHDGVIEALSTGFHLI